LEVLHVADRASVTQHPAAREQLLQHTLSRLELDVRQVVAAEIRQVEDLVNQPARSVRGQRLLKLSKAARAVRLKRDQLAVEQRLVDVEIREGIDERRKARRPILAVAAEEPHGAPFDTRNQTVAVELDLVQPAVAARRRARPGRELRIEAARHWRGARAGKRRVLQPPPRRRRALSRASAIVTV